MPISIVIRRNRTLSVHVGYGLYFYFSGLSLRGTSKYCPHDLSNETAYLSGTGYKSITLKSHQRKRGLKYVIGETVLKVGQ
jgi:hypothetical protein